MEEETEQQETEQQETRLQELALQYLWNNYDYCYLKAMHEKNRQKGASIIIAGASHAMNGVVEKEMSAETINFSISSQDLYYDFLHIKKAIKEGRQQIKYCVINIGYYMLYQDVSLSRTLDYMIPTIYSPLFGAVHHYKGNLTYDMWADCRKSAHAYPTEQLQRFCMDFASAYFMKEGSYYGTVKTREQNSLLPINGIIWQDLQEFKKEVYAQKRAMDHNRLRKYTQSHKENAQIVEQIVRYLHGKGIMPIFTVFPFTRYYDRYIDRRYKKDIYNLLDNLPLQVEFLDMNDYLSLFEDEDYLDTDHLNLAGASKATKLLNEFIITVG